MRPASFALAALLVATSLTPVAQAWAEGSGSPDTKPLPVQASGQAAPPAAPGGSAAAPPPASGLPPQPPAAGYVHDAPASFAPLAKRLLPAVVNISSTQTIKAQSGDRPDAPDMPQVPPGSPFEQFFRDFMQRNGGGAPQPPRRAQSLGSGFIVDPSGIVVTNNHVIDGADEINVILQDNTTLKATVIGVDKRTDLAVLRVHADKPLPAIPFGDSDKVQVGDWVLAIGNPFGLGGSVTAGIVSARGRDIRQGMYDDFIQTDAAINRGNSGGPLFDMAGEVIGINTAIYSPSGGSIGIGFSIPSNLARNIVAQLRQDGRVRRGWLAVNIQQVTDDIAESLGLKGGARGALVARAMDDGPAAKAGIQSGDVILKFGDHDVKEMRALPRIVAETPVGSDVPVLLWRNGKEMTVHVKLAEQPQDLQAAAAGDGASKPKAKAEQPTELAALGLKVAPITDDMRERFSLKPDQKGLVVVDVLPTGPASDADVRPGDVILEAQQEAITTPKQLEEQVERLRRQKRPAILLMLQGQGGQRFVPLKLGEANAPG